MLTFLQQNVREIKPTSLCIDQDLKCLPFFDGAHKNNLKEELPTYLSKVNDLDDAYNPLQWWKKGTKTLVTGD